MAEFLEQIHFSSQCWVIGLPALLMALDILTGLIYAWTSRTFDSARMRAGLGKKFGELAYLVIAAAAVYGMSLPRYILYGVVLYISFMELMSIIENCDKLGAPVPKFVRVVVNNVGHALDTAEDPDDVADVIKHPTEEAE